MFMNDEDLLDLDKELNEAGGLGYDAQDKKGPKEEAKGGVTGAGSYGRHAAPSGPPPPSSARGISSPASTSAGRGKIKAPAGPPPSSVRPSTAEIKADSIDDDASMGSTLSAGGTSSRARILAQQRELMMKRRQEGMKAGMVRSVDSPIRPALDAQHTPAIKQFSTPRVVNDDPYSTFSSSGGKVGKDEAEGTPRPGTRGSDHDRDNGEDFSSPASTSQRSQRVSSDSDHPPRRPYPDAPPGSRDGPSSARDGPGRPGSREREAPPADDHDADYYDRPRSVSSRPAPSGRGRPPPPEGPPSTRRRGDYPEDEHYNSSGGLREGREGGSSWRSRGGDRGERGERDYDREGYAREYDDRDGYRGERGYGREREAEDRRGDRGERDGHYDDYDYEARRPPPSGRGYRGEERGRGDRGYDDRDYDRDRDYERERRRPPRDDADRDREREYDREYGGSGGRLSARGRPGERPPSTRGPPSDPRDGPPGSTRGDRPRGPPMGEEEHDERHAASTAYRNGSTTPTDRDRRGSGNSKGRGGREDHAAPKDDRQAPPQDEEEEDEEGEGEEDDDESDGDDKELAQAAPKPAATGAGARDEAAAAKNASPSLDFLDLDSPDALLRFLSAPCPKKAGIVQCHIRRRKGGAGKLYPEYYLYLKQGDRFLLAGRKRPNNKTSNYMITRSETDWNKDSDKYLGKLRANFVGTEFQVFDNGSNPKDDDDRRSGSSKTREELAVVLYASNVLGSRGPRKMQVCIPQVRPEDDSIMHWRESKDRVRDDELLEKLRRGDTSKLNYFINKPPRWNDQVGAYVLNFNGRVTMASVKNFQLIDPDDQEAIILQFGRVGKDEFTMDMQWPISPFQAFAVTLSSFDSKIACD